jgi:predicted site-specific integrase-resolvase
MGAKGGEDLVSSGVILRDFDVANSTLYRMVREGRIPAVNVTKPYHKRQRFLFRVSDVERVLPRRTGQPPAD